MTSPNFSAKDHSFVLCAYGESPYLEECLLSLLNQNVKTSYSIATTTPNAHIQSIAAKYDVPLFINEGQPGIAHDWNCAVSHCSTPLVTIAHQDDVYEPNYVEKMLEAMNCAPGPLIFFSNYGELRCGEKVDSSKLLGVKRMLLSEIQKKGSVSKRSQKRRLIAVGSAICCPSVTYNVPALPSPLFLEGMKSNLDWEAWERFSLLDGSFVYSDQILMRHRIHEGSETSHLIRDNTRTAEDLAMLQKFWSKPMAALINKAYGSGQKSNDL